METDLLPNVRGNVQTLRNMWSSKVQEEQKLLKLPSTACRTQSPLQQKSSIKDTTQTPKSTDGTSVNQTPTFTFDREKSVNFESISSSPSIDDDANDFLPLPPPPPSIILQQQAKSIATLQQSITKMFDTNKKKSPYPDVKNKGIRHWHIARHVFRSGLIFGPSRRASDSIIPLLMKTHIAQSRSRTDSMDSIPTQTPFEHLIDYLACNKDEEMPKTFMMKPIVKRTVSDTGACIERNKLNDTIVQYETVIRHLKNYDKFMETYPVPSAQQLIQTEQIEDNSQQASTTKSSIRSRQTQSLARSTGRTFTDFIMNDCLLSPTSNERRHSSTVHAASQTDLTELIEKMDSIPPEEASEVLEEPETDKEVALTANSEINVIVVTSPMNQERKEETKPKEKEVMQKLFEGKKSAYNPSDLNMKSVRIPDELRQTFELAKTKCFFPTEQLIYSTKMMKIDRRGYKQHVRLLCLTSERLYIITKKDPYPKEAVLFGDILGISCTPCKDGFICLHTRETREDRGDWIFFVDHPCEFITQLFMAMGRSDNHDNFLEIKPKFKHTRRNIATLTDECAIEVRPADTLRIECEDYETLVIYTP